MSSFSLESNLRRGIEDLRAFTGFPSDFEARYESLRLILAELIRVHGNLTLPPHIQALEKDLHRVALETRQKARERMRQADRAALLQHRQEVLLKR